MWSPLRPSCFWAALCLSAQSLSSPVVKPSCASWTLRSVEWLPFYWSCVFPSATGGLCPGANDPCVEKPCPGDMQCVGYEASRRPFLCQCPPGKLGECSGAERGGMRGPKFIFWKPLPFQKTFCLHVTFSFRMNPSQHPPQILGIYYSCSLCSGNMQCLWVPYIMGDHSLCFSCVVWILRVWNYRK